MAAIPAALAEMRLRFGMEASALIWWTTPSSSPVLATTSTAGVAQLLLGSLGLTQLRRCLAATTFSKDQEAAFGLRSGFWFDPCGINGIVFEYFILGKASEGLNLNSDTTPIIARPFTNFSTAVGIPDSQLIAFPGLNTGSLDIKATTQLHSMAVHFSSNTGAAMCSGRSMHGPGTSEFHNGAPVRTTIRQPARSSHC